MRRSGRVALASALALVAVGCGGSGACDEPGALCLSPETATRVGLGFYPDALALADVDGDGARDLVGVSSGLGTLTVVWGDGAGLSGAATTWTIGREATGVVVADLDGDGRRDLATAVPGDDAVAVLRGRGGRSFAGPERRATGSVPRALVAADLDGEGPAELVTANLGDGTFSVLRRLVAAPPVVVGPGPRGLAAGDLDGDGDVDLAVALADAGAVQVLLGDGAGGLSPGALHAVGAAPHAVAAGDFNDDGALDLATADALDDTVSVLLSDGAGGHRGRAAFATLLQPSALAATRDEGGRDVLGVLSRGTSAIQRLDPRDGQALDGVTWRGAAAIAGGDPGELVYAGGEIGALMSGEGLRLTPLWEDIRPAVDAWPIDLEGDGVDELVVLERVEETDSLSLLRGPKTAEPLETGFTVAGNYAAVAGDVTGDGRRDLVVWTDSELVVLVQHDGGALLPASSPLTLSLGHPRVVLGDVDGDGASDVLLSGWEADKSLLLRLTSDPTGLLTLDGAGSFELPFFVKSMQLIDGDLVFVGHDGLYRLAGAGLPAQPIPFVGADELDEFAVDDLDGDGDLDAVASSRSRGLFVVRDLFGSGPVSLLYLHPDIGSRFHLGDLDGDGALDLMLPVLRFSSTGESSTLFSPWLQRDGAWEREGGVAVDGYFPVATGVRLAQLDDDGVPDVLALEAGYGLRAFAMSFGPALVEAPAVRPGALPDARLGDLDGDGAADLVAVGDGIGVARADGEGGFGPLRRRTFEDVFGTPFGRITGRVLADFDGDGAGELVVGLTGGGVPGTVYYRLDVDDDDEGRFTPAPLAYLPLGALDLHAADLDGDGARDLVALATGFALDAFLLAGDGAGGFAAATWTSAASPGQISSTTLVDFDRDGLLDVVAASYESLLLFRGRGDGSFAGSERLAPVYPYTYAAGDFDRDGRTDLAYTSLYVASAQVQLLRGGTATPRVLLDGVRAVAPADLDGDGQVELLAAGDLSSGPPGRGTLHIGRPTDDGRLVFARREVPADRVRAIRTADVDGDADLDVALLDDDGVTIVRQDP